MTYDQFVVMCDAYLFIYQPIIQTWLMFYWLISILVGVFLLVGLALNRGLSAYL